MRYNALIFTHHTSKLIIYRAKSDHGLVSEADQWNTRTRGGIKYKMTCSDIDNRAESPSSMHNAPRGYSVSYPRGANSYQG